MPQSRRNPILLNLIAFSGNLFFDRALWLIYLSERGYSLLQIGLLESILHLTTILFELPTGVVADFVGRKWSLIMGRVFIALYLVGMLFANSLLVTAVCFSLFGLGLTFISGAEEALLFDSIGDSEKQSATRLLGGYMGLITLGLAVAMALGGLLRSVDWTLVFGASALCQLVAAALTAFLIEVGSVQETERRTLSGHIRATVGFFRSSPTAGALMAGLAIYSGVVSTYYMFSQNLLHDMGFSAPTVSALFAAESLLSAGGSAKAYLLEHWLRPKWALLSSLLITALVFVLVASSLTTTGVVAFFIISFVGSLFSPISSAVVNRELPSEQRATLLSVISFAGSIIIALLFPLVGHVADQFDIRWVLSSVGLVSVGISLVLCAYFFFPIPEFAKKRNRASWQGFQHGGEEK